MNSVFSQTIEVHCSDPEQLVEMMREWDRDQANADVMGYMGMRILADRDHPGQYIVVADFGVVDPDVSAAEEAERNNQRPETQATAAAMRAISDGEPVYRHFDCIYRTEG